MLPIPTSPNAAAFYRDPSSPHRVTVLGATGSIGDHTLAVLQAHPERFSVVAVTAHTNAAKLAEVAVALRAKIAVVADDAAYPELFSRLAGTGITAMGGEQAVIEAATLPTDIVVAGITGFSGLRPIMAAIEQGYTIALANKEALVAAGDVVLAALHKHQAMLLPVDSEHSAIFQLWNPLQAHAVEKVTLTASGGPFRGWSAAQMAAATPEQAINHPKWRMGAKISVDSATLMNKGLELIEAHYLFNLPPEKLDVVVHPESIIHSFVHYHDGSVLAQLGMPDMCTPLAVALAWPERIDVPRPRLDLTQLAQLQFEAVDEALFPCLSLAKEALAQGGSLPAVLNAANEEAVAAFLKTQIGFAEIASVVEAVLARAEILQPQTLAEVVELDHISRCRAREYIARQRMQMLLLSLQQEQLRNAIQAQSRPLPAHAVASPVRYTRSHARTNPLPRPYAPLLRCDSLGDRFHP